MSPTPTLPSHPMQRPLHELPIKRPLEIPMIPIQPFRADILVQLAHPALAKTSRLGAQLVGDVFEAEVEVACEERAHVGVFVVAD